MVAMCRRCWGADEEDGRGISARFEGGRTSETQAGRVDRCPGCGERVVGEGLQDRQPGAVSLTAHAIAEELGIPTDAARALISSAAPGRGRTKK